MFSGDRPRPHDDRPQPARRGVRTGAAAARRDVRRGRDLLRARARTRRHPRRHRPRHRGAARGARRADLPQPRRRARPGRREHLDRGARPGRGRPAGRPHRRARRRRPTAPGDPARVPRRVGRLREGRCRRRSIWCDPPAVDDPAAAEPAATSTTAGHRGRGSAAVASTPRPARVPDGALVLVDGLLARRRCSTETGRICASSCSCTCRGGEPWERRRPARGRRGGRHQPMDPRWLLAGTTWTRDGCGSPSPGSTARRSLPGLGRRRRRCCASAP